MNRRIRFAFATCLAALAIGPGIASAETTETWGTYGVQTQWMDSATRPGDDFDRYVNGKWYDTVVMPADKARYGGFVQMADLSEERLKGLVEDIAASKPKPGTDAARIADAYTAFMDTTAINAKGMAPAQPYLQRIYAAQTREDLIDLMAAPGIPSVIGGGVGPDAKDSNKNTYNLGQAGLGLPDREYYLSSAQRFVDIRAKYVDYLSFLLGKAGYQDPVAAAKSVLALETDLAKAQWDRAASRNRDVRYNKLSMADIAALPNGALLTRFIDKASDGRVASAGDGTVIMAQIPPSADKIAELKLTPEQAAKYQGGIPATMKLVAEAPMATWQAWMAARFIAGSAGVLPTDIDDATFAFYGKTLSGLQAQQPRWKRALGIVEGEVGELIGKAYADRYFPAANRTAMADMIANLRKAMAANLADLAWMGPETRAQALAKLGTFNPKIGAPNVWKKYEGLTITRDNAVANAVNAGLWGRSDNLRRLGQPVDKTEWFMLPETVNAYYNSTFNEIVFPAAILQPPFFNLSADPAVNYGGIGAVIGHEMGHGFDDQGSKSDEKGNLRDWWTAQDKANFEELQKKLGAQYAQFCPYDDGKTCVNPLLTMGENIGDIGGISLAYRAYRMSLNGKEAPVIDGMTGDQRFFLGFAQIWRSMDREAAARQRLLTDPHSPPHFRINGVVRNMDEWYKAFDIKPGDKLYVPPEQRVRIW